MPRVGIVVDGGNEAKNLADTVNAAIVKALRAAGRPRCMGTATWC